MEFKINIPPGYMYIIMYMNLVCGENTYCFFD